MSTEDKDAAVLVRARTGQEAQVILGVLQANGIPARVSGSELQDEFAMSQKAMNLGGVDILVPRASLDDAQRILAAARTAGEAMDGGDDAGGE